MTNFERIKAMSVEEMAKWVVDQPSCIFPTRYCYGMLCHECWCEWLEMESEVQDEAD